MNKRLIIIFLWLFMSGCIPESQTLSPTQTTQSRTMSVKPTTTLVKGEPTQLSPTPSVVKATSTPLAFGTPKVDFSTASTDSWLIFSLCCFDEGYETLSAVNQEGTVVHNMTGFGSVRAASLSPDASLLNGFDIAYVANGPGNSDWGLTIVRRHGGNEQIIEEVALKYEDRFLYDPVWSHDSTKLTVIAAGDTGSPTIHVFDMQTHQLSRLSAMDTGSEPTWWSPNDDYILFGHVGSMLSYDGGYYPVWSQRSNGEGEPILLQTESPDPQLLGWLDNYTVALAALDDFANTPTTVRIVDIRTGDIHAEHSGLIRDAAYDPFTNVFALAEGERWCDPTNELRLVVSDQPVALIPGAGCAVWWLEEIHQFLAYGEHDVVDAKLISPTGAVTDIKTPFAAPVNPLFSPDKRYWAWNYSDQADGYYLQGGLWISQSTQNFQQIYQGYVTGLSWSPDSRALFFGGQDGLYVAKVPNFEPQLISAYPDGRQYYFGPESWLK